MMRAPLHAALGWLGCACCLFVAFPAHAQLDIFEKPKNSGTAKPPPQRRGFTFGTFKVGGNQGAKQMQEGSRFYAQGNYEAASLRYFTVVKKMEGSRFHQTAQYQLAKTLYRMGLYHPALDYFTQIIQVGSSGGGHRHFRSALSWAILISRRLQNESMFLGKLKKFRTSDFPNKYRNELFYLLGKFYFQNEKLPVDKRLKVSINLLRNVQPRDPQFYARAQYIIGIIYDSARRANDAARAFRRTISTARRLKKKEEQRNLLELGVLGLARIHYGAKHFRAAIGYYRLIDRSSKRWLDVIFERAWSHMRRGQYGQTLGLLHTLNSPYFRNEYFPEIGILQSLSFFERCRYKEAKKIIKRYLSRYRPLSGSIQNFLTRNPNSAQMFQAINRLRNQEETKGLDDPSEQMFQRLLKLTFKDKKIRGLFDYIRELTRELGVINTKAGIWKQSELARALKQGIIKERVAKLNQAGARATKRFRATKEEIDGLVSQALKIQYEILSEEKKLLDKSSRQQGSFRMKSANSRKRRMITVAAPEDYVFWPWQGEYWVDELGYYRYRLRGECDK